ncbi:MAG: hypothetical protein Q7J05_06750 [Paludibacter sp.]|nr:hypothetical protein [Paludibacter sp.]
MKIEEDLDFQIWLTEHLPNLSLHEPDKEVWKRVSAQLPVNKRISFRIKIISVAASIAVIMLLSTVLLQMHKGNLRTETDIAFTALTESDMEQEAMTEIRSYCNLHMPACEQSDYKALMQLFEELKSEEYELKKAMSHLGDSPEMIQALIKIENMKSEAIQDLILLIQS